MFPAGSSSRHFRNLLMWWGNYSRRISGYSTVGSLHLCSKFGSLLELQISSLSAKRARPSIVALVLPGQARNTLESCIVQQITLHNNHGAENASLCSFPPDFKHLGSSSAYPHLQNSYRDQVPHHHHLCKDGDCHLGEFQQHLDFSSFIHASRTANSVF